MCISTGRNVLEGYDISKLVHENVQKQVFFVLWYYKKFRQLFKIRFKFWK